MLIKVLVRKDNPAVFGIIENQSVHYAMMPECLQPSVTMQQLEKYVAPDQVPALHQYELQTFKLEKISP